MSDHQLTKYRGVLFIGAPGSGKGTQTQAIGNLPGFYPFATGATLRSLDPDSNLGSQVQGFMRSGDLVPDELVLTVFQSHLESASDAGGFDPENDLVLLDAYPRDVAQARSLDEHIELIQAIHLRVDDDEVLKQRLRKRNARPDDRDEEVIAHRFEVYHRQTRPLLDDLPRQQITDVDAAASPLKVLDNVVSVLTQVMSELECGLHCS